MAYNFIISWKDYEYKHSPKDARWFWYVIGVAVVFIIISIFSRNILFIFFIVIGAGSFILSVLRRPKHILYGVTNKGIVIDKSLYPFEAIESFCIREEEENVLVLKSEKTFMPYITLPLEKTDSKDVKDILLKKLPEEEHEKTLVEVFFEYIGL